MEIDALYQTIADWFQSHLIELIVSAVIVLLYFISKRVIKKLIIRQETKRHFDKGRSLYISKVTGLVNFLVFFAFLGFTWELSLSGLGVYFASIFTVVGVGLFANWSILSNISASVILFFFFPYRIGSRVRIQDGDNSVEGIILDITIFYVEIETEENKVVSYPNNLAIQKPFYLLQEAED